MSANSNKNGQNRYRVRVRVRHVDCQPASQPAGLEASWTDKKTNEQHIEMTDKGKLISLDSMSSRR